MLKDVLENAENIEVRTIEEQKIEEGNDMDAGDVLDKLAEIDLQNYQRPHDLIEFIVDNYGVSYEIAYEVLDTIIREVGAVAEDDKPKYKVSKNIKEAAQNLDKVLEKWKEIHGEDGEDDKDEKNK